MSMIPVNSTAIRAIGHDGRTLFVQFRSRATIYCHPRVPAWVYLGLLAAPSVGAYYNRHIRGRFR